MRLRPLRSMLAVVPVLFLATGCQTTTAPDRFTAADINHDEALSAEEANTYFVTQIFDSRDANKDGKLTEAEWVVGGDVAQQREFRARDTDRDGTVTRQEAIAYGQRKGMSRQLLSKADSNRDGSLSRAEVTAYYGSKEGPPH